jgi:hypothetical protein
MSDYDAEFFSGIHVEPPRGTVLKNVDVKGGPPMLRMIMLQFACSFVMKFRVSKSMKALMIAGVCAWLLKNDLHEFMN